MSPARKSTKKASSKPTRTSTAKASSGFSAEEKAAMQATIRERKAAGNREQEEKAALQAIGAMQEPDRSMARRIHAIIKESAPSLSPKTWYGMPAYATGDGKVVCFFQTGQKFKTRYCTFGFNDSARLDNGDMWPVAFALTKLTAADEARIAALVKRAVG